MDPLTFGKAVELLSHIWIEGVFGHYNYQRMKWNKYKNDIQVLILKKLTGRQLIRQLQHFADKSCWEHRALRSCGKGIVSCNYMHTLTASLQFWPEERTFLRRWRFFHAEWAWAVNDLSSSHSTCSNLFSLSISTVAERIAIWKYPTATCSSAKYLVTNFIEQKHSFTDIQQRAIEREKRKGQRDWLLYD